MILKKYNKSRISRISLKKNYIPEDLRTGRTRNVGIEVK